jgi:hypothetical protein
MGVSKLYGSSLLKYPYSMLTLGAIANYCRCVPFRTSLIVQMSYFLPPFPKFLRGPTPFLRLMLLLLFTSIVSTLKNTGTVSTVTACFLTWS